MNVNDKGNIGFANVLADLVNNGYFVFIPIADTTSVDLIAADKGMNLKRIQIKYRKINKNGVISVSTESIVNGKRVSADFSQTDIWAIYCPDNKKIYYLSSDFLKGKTGVSLRESACSKIANTMTFAEDFLDIKKVWL